MDDVLARVTRRGIMAIMSACRAGEAGSIPVAGAKQVNDKACKKHEDEDCQLCSKYRLTMTLWNGRQTSVDLWVGQNAGISSGPMGMEDEVYLEYIPAPIVQSK
jgi:hypothetical protein